MILKVFKQSQRFGRIRKFLKKRKRFYFLLFIASSVLNYGWVKKYDTIPKNPIQQHEKVLSPLCLQGGFQAKDDNHETNPFAKDNEEKQEISQNSSVEKLMQEIQELKSRIKDLEQRNAILRDEVLQGLRRNSYLAAELANTKYELHQYQKK